MKRITKLILIAILSLVMACGITGAVVLADIDKGSVTVTVATEYGVAGDKVDVTVTLSNNTGLGALSVFVDYDSNLTLDSVVFNNELGGNPIASNFKVTGSPVKLTWVTDGEYTGNGVFATLSFIVSSEATDGDFSELTLALDEAYDKDYNDVDVTLVDGGVILSGFPAGDVNHDKKVNTKDVRVLLQYIATGYDITIDEILADVNSDGKVDTKDARILLRFIAGGYDEKLISPKKINTVTFNGNGGTLVSGNEKQKVKYGESAVAPEYTRSGYIFDGFDADFSNVTKDLTVNAQWIENKQLSTPVIKNIDDDIIQWNAVENATTYTVRVTDVKGLQYEYVAQNESTACSLAEVKRDGKTIPANRENCGYVSVKIKANANNGFSESEWSATDSSYYYIPDSPINDEVKNLYIGYGYNLNEWEYFNPEPVSKSLSSVLNLNKLLTIADFQNPGVHSGMGQSFVYETIDEYISKFADSLSLGTSFVDKAGRLLGLYINASAEHSTSTGTKTYEKNITLKTEYCVREKAFELSLDDFSVLKNCLSSQFKKDLMKKDTETIEQYCARIYNKYGTVSILGVVTGGVKGYNYTVSTNSNEVYNSVKTSFNISVGVDLQQMLNAGFNLGCSVEEFNQQNTSTTKATLTDSFRGGSIKLKSTTGGSDNTEWELSDKSVIPIELTNNGAIAISSLISMIYPEYAQYYDNYVMMRADAICMEMYQKYVQPSTISMEIDNNGVLTVDVSSIEGIDIANVKCSYLDGNVLTIYPTFSGKDVKTIRVIGNYNKSKKLVEGLSIKLFGWKRDVNVVFSNVGVSCALENGLLDYSLVKGNVNVSYTGLNCVKDINGKNSIIAVANEKTYNFIFDVGGEETLDFSYVSLIDGVLNLPSSSKPHYKLAGWYDSDNVKVTDENGKLLNSYQPKTDKIVLHAEYEFIVKNYTVTFDQNGGGTIMVATSVVVTLWCEMPKLYIEGGLGLKFNAAAPTRTGYTFDGYWLKDEQKQYYNANLESVNIWDIEEDTVLYAKWIPNRYNLLLINNILQNTGNSATYTGNELTAIYSNLEYLLRIKSNSDPYVTIGQDMYLIANTKYYVHMKVTNLERKSISSVQMFYAINSAYVESQSLRFSGEMTLSFTAPTTGLYKIRLDNDAGKDVYVEEFWVSPQEYNKISIDYDSKILTKTVTVPSRDEFVFLGYYDKSGVQYFDQNGQRVESIVYKVTKDTILYAKWGRLKYRFDTGDRSIKISPEYDYSIETFGENVNPGFSKENLIACGYTKLKISVRIGIAEIEDGYQYVTIWAGGEKQWSQDIEHGSNKDESWWYHDFSCEISILKTSDTCLFALNYSAHGKGDDTWKLGRVIIDVEAIK